MKKSTTYIVLGGLAALTAIAFFAMRKTKKVAFIWNTEDTDFGENLCQNCNC